MPQHVAVLMGGLAAERPVSLNSGKACAKALREGGFTSPRSMSGAIVSEVLARLRPDVAFNALHGPMARMGDPGRARIAAHSLYAFGRACLLPGDEQGAGQVVAAAAGVSFATGIVASPSRWQRSIFCRRLMWRSRSPTAPLSAFSSSRRAQPPATGTALRRMAAGRRYAGRGIHPRS